MDSTECERLAGAVAALRPDWPVGSLRAWVRDNLAGRTYRDAAVALVWVAVEPETRTPGRVLSPGPWWAVTGSERPARRLTLDDLCAECAGPREACDHNAPSVREHRAAIVARAAARPAGRNAEPELAEAPPFAEHVEAARVGIAAGRARLAEWQAELDRRNGRPTSDENNPGTAPSGHGDGRTPAGGDVPSPETAEAPQ